MIIFKIFFRLTVFVKMASIKRPGYDHLLKLIIIGDSSVGKTCILLRFSEDNFPTTHMPTIGKLNR